jgi:hypothetical protein
MRSRRCPPPPAPHSSLSRHLFLRRRRTHSRQARQHQQSRQTSSRRPRRPTLPVRRTPHRQRSRQRQSPRRHLRPLTRNSQLTAVRNFRFVAILSAARDLRSNPLSNSSVQCVRFTSSAPPAPPATPLAPSSTPQSSTPAHASNISPARRPSTTPSPTRLPPRSTCISPAKSVLP